MSNEWVSFEWQDKCFKTGTISLALDLFVFFFCCFYQSLLFFIKTRWFLFASFRFVDPIHRLLVVPISLVTRHGMLASSPAFQSLSFSPLHPLHPCVRVLTKPWSSPAGSKSLATTTSASAVSWLTAGWSFHIILSKMRYFSIQGHSSFVHLCTLITQIFLLFVLTEIPWFIILYLWLPCT